MTRSLLDRGTLGPDWIAREIAKAALFPIPASGFGASTKEMPMFGKLMQTLKGGASRLSGKDDLLEAICAGCALIAAADGEVEDAELAATAMALSSHPTLSDAFAPSKIDAVAEKMFASAKTTMGRTRLWNEVEQARAKSTSDDLEVALAVCVDVAKSDGEIEKAEQPVLARLAQSWGVSLQAVMAA